MKRRLFLKKGGLGITGVAVAPLLISTGCDLNSDNKTTDTGDEEAIPIDSVLTDGPQVDLGPPSTDAYKVAAMEYLTGAEELNRNDRSTEAMQLIALGSTMLYQASENVQLEAHELNVAELDVLESAATEVVEGAEILNSLESRVLSSQSYGFDGAKLREGSQEMIQGADLGLQGAIEMNEMPGYKQDGSKKVEAGAMEVMNGAIELVDGFEGIYYI